MLLYLDKIEDGWILHVLPWYASSEQFPHHDAIRVRVCSLKKRTPAIWFFLFRFLLLCTLLSLPLHYFSLFPFTFSFSLLSSLFCCSLVLLCFCFSFLLRYLVVRMAYLKFGCHPSGGAHPLRVRIRRKQKRLSRTRWTRKNNTNNECFPWVLFNMYC